MKTEILNLNALSRDEMKNIKGGYPTATLYCQSLNTTYICNSKDGDILSNGSMLCGGQIYTCQTHNI